MTENLGARVWQRELLGELPVITPGEIALAEIRLTLQDVGGGTLALDVDEEIRRAATAAGWLVIRDHEGAPVAVVRVDPRLPEGQVTGIVEGVAGADPGSFADLRIPPSRFGPDNALLIVGHDPVDSEALRTAERFDGPVALVILDGPRIEPGPPTTEVVRAASTTASMLRRGHKDAYVVVVPAPQYGDKRDDEVRERIGVAYGAARTLPSSNHSRDTLLAALDGAMPLPDLPPESEAAWRRYRPPREQRGVTVLLTGLSGSGKSTIARALTQSIAETSSRTVTLLDGDVVRRMLSAGLGFSRSDRDRNVLRIGYVAAEITRHGGVAICAPIAPFDQTRRHVRRMVTEHGDFVLVHVATPLEECERRDRKGLYARARAGAIPEFTGISSPYEVPTDADLVIDTSEISVRDAAAHVLDYLREGGWLPTTFRSERGIEA